MFLSLILIGVKSSTTPVNGPFAEPPLLAKGLVDGLDIRIWADIPVCKVSVKVKEISRDVLETTKSSHESPSQYETIELEAPIYDTPSLHLATN